MWKYDSPIGIMKIIYDPRYNKYALVINKIIYGHYASPVAAADDVFVHVTGCYKWDSLDGKIDTVPTDLHEWIEL